jgi:hypothetical protein
MGTWELTFEVQNLTEDLVDELMEEMDATPAWMHGVQTVAVSASGDSATAAAAAAATALMRRGLHVRRLYEDLVTRADIAARCDVSKQNVGQWIRGERGSDFPAPYHAVGSGVWLWGEVNDWLASTRRSTDGASYPDRATHARVNGWLQRLSDNRAGWSAPLRPKAQAGVAVQYDTMASRTVPVATEPDAFQLAS